MGSGVGQKVMAAFAGVPSRRRVDVRWIPRGAGRPDYSVRHSVRDSRTAGMEDPALSKAIEPAKVVDWPIALRLRRFALAAAFEPQPRDLI